MTCCELAAVSAGIADQLLDRGVKPGDRVVTLFDKSFANVAAMFGVWNSGGVVVNLNSKLPPSMLRSVIADCDPRMVLASESLAGLLRSSETPIDLRGVLIIDESLNPRSARSTPDFKPAMSGGDLATVIYTSGSTGRQKGVMLSHASLLHHVEAVTAYLHNTANDRLVSVLPFYFGYGLSQLLTAVGVGASLSLIDSFVYPQQVLDVLEGHRITGMAGVPSHFQMLLAHGNLHQRDFSALRYITISGSSASADLVGALRSALPATKIFLMFGQTESCIRSCYLPPEEIDRRPTSIGRAIPGVQVLVLDEEGNEIAADGVGELVCRGPNVMLGYWNDPELSARVLRSLPGSNELALFTGDLVRRDAEGFLYFLGRKDEMIKSGAHRIFPMEIELVLQHAPGVREVAVVGADDPSLGQVVIAHVVLNHGAAMDQRALLEHCRRDLPAYMVPRRVVFHESLPRTATGKIRKMELSSPPQGTPAK